jgi:glycosyltransferase involved in cell wall biosynthesis
MEHFVLRIAHAQQLQGHHAVVMALHGGALQQDAELLGIPVFLSSQKQKLFRLFRFISRIKQLSPDIIHAHNESSLHYAILGKRLTKARVVMTHHGQGLGAWRNAKPNEWRFTDAIVTVSKAVAQKAVNSITKNKITTIYNGIPYSIPKRDRKAVRQELSLKPSQIVGTIVARIDTLKGHDTLLHALAIIKRKGIASTVLVVGDGTMRSHYEKLASEIGLGAEEVRFLGFRTDIPDILAASDFFVLPSLTEGLPLSILEAMSHSLPILATPVGGIPELVKHHRHGLLFPVQDAEALAGAMEQIITYPHLRQEMGENGFQKVRDEFSFEQMTSAYEALYQNLLAPQGAL